MKTRVLILTDSPLITSGQGNVHRQIGWQLHNRGYEVISLGWHDDYTDIKVPWKVYRTDKRFYYGEGLFDGVVENHRPDIVLTIGDTWNYAFVAKSRVRYLFYWLGYVAIDGVAHNSCVPLSWNPILKDMDKMIAYTEYGQKALEMSIPDERGKIPIIPHGVDHNVFHPLGKDKVTELRNRHGIREDYLIYLIVARNQFRKNIPELFKAWALFRNKTRYQKTLLWPHMLFNDSAGWNLTEIIDICGIRGSIVYLEDYATASSNLDVISEEKLNALYNIADVFVLMSGEGFGLPLLEAMACGKPVIALNHSATGELAKGHGELVRVSGYITGAKSTERPIPDAEDLVRKLEIMYDQPELREKYSKESLEYAKQFDWNKIGDMWDYEIKKALNPFIDKCNLVRVS